MFKFLKGLFHTDREVKKAAGYEWAAGNMLRMSKTYSVSQAISSVEQDIEFDGSAFDSGVLEAILDFRNLVNNSKSIDPNGVPDRCECGGPLVKLSTIKHWGSVQLGTKVCSRCFKSQVWPLKEGQKPLVSSNRGDRRHV